MKNSVLRTCIVTKEVLNKKDLLRFVYNTKLNKVVADPIQKLPGRGCYIKPSLENLEKAFKIRAFERALKIKSISEENKNMLKTFIDSLKVSLR